MKSLTCLLALTLCLPAKAWVLIPITHQIHTAPHRHHQHACQTLTMSNDDDTSSNSIDMDSLMDMDIVLFTRKDNQNNTELGAIQEDGTLAPLSAWTDEYAFEESIEFVVDEEDRLPGLTSKDVNIIQVLDENVIGYGSRQVGGGMGPGNPHGEESEICYYVDESVLNDVNVVIKPELEIFW